MLHRIFSNGAIEIFPGIFRWQHSFGLNGLLDEIKTAEGKRNVLKILWQDYGSFGFFAVTYKLKRGQCFPDGVKVLKQNVVASFETPKEFIPMLNRQEATDHEADC